MAKSRQIIGAMGVTWLALSACGGEAMKSGAGSGGAGSGGAAPSGGDVAGGFVSFGGSGSTFAGAPAAAGQAVGGRPGLGGAPPQGGRVGFGGATLNAGGEGGVSVEGGAAGAGGEAGAGGASPALELTHGSWSCPSDQLSVAASSSAFIGGIDRWLITFEWKCTVVSLGVPARAKLEVGLVQPLTTPLDQNNRTFYWESANPLLDYEVRSATVWLRGSGVPEIAVNLLPSSSFLTVRREGDQLLGGVHYEGDDSTHSNRSTLAAPFSVPVPKF